MIGMGCGGAMASPFIGLSTFLLFGSSGLVVLVLVLLAWLSARQKFRALQTEVSHLRRNQDTLQWQFERMILTSINQNRQKSSLLVHGRPETS
jgi:hypothetical protein